MIKTASICENRLYLTLYKKGRYSVSNGFVLYYRKNSLSGRIKNRLGITVSTKIGCAAVRNRCKRVLREAYRLSEPEIADNCDFVLVARQRTPELKTDTVKAELRKILVDFRLLNTEKPTENPVSPYQCNL